MKKVFTALSAGVALLFASCVDTEFDLGNISGEMTIGGEELVVPLADIDAITLNDLIGENEFITTDKEGVYQISYSSFGDNPNKYESLKVDGISIPNITGLSPKLDPIQFSFQELPTKLTMRGISEKFEVDLPTVNNLVAVRPISVEKDIAVSLPSNLSGQGNLPDYAASMLPSLQLTSTEEIVFEAKIAILKELKQIDFVEFGCDEHPFGAPFEVTVDLNGLKDINGGGTAKFNLEFPKGYYLRDEQGNDFPEATHNIFTKEIAIGKQQKSVTLICYLNKIDYSDHTFVDGNLNIEDHISYSYDISLSLCGGNYNLDAKPKFALKSAPDCQTSGSVYKEKKWELYTS